MSEEKETRMIAGMEFEVISMYTDDMAVEDGILVPLNGQDRVTRACWEWMADKLGDSPPDRWPVELMGYIGAESGDDRALAAAKGLLGSWEKKARTVYEENIGGGIFTLWVRESDEAIIGITDSEFGDGEATRLWFIPNELGGMTLMFPEDY